MINAYNHGFMKFVYIADIDGDIDDIVAIEWLHRNDLLQCVVMDGQSRNSALEGYVSNLPARFSYDIPENTKTVFCGGALTPVAKYLKAGGKLDWLFMNGGFAGSNIVPLEEQLPKFRNKTHVRTFNFNLDVESARYVLNSSSIENIKLVSKNVCHSHHNTIAGVHKEDYEWIWEHYKLQDHKRLHDLLMVKEGAHMFVDGESILKYNRVSVECLFPKPGEHLNMTRWGAIRNLGSHISISVGWKDEAIKNMEKA